MFANSQDRGQASFIANFLMERKLRGDKLNEVGMESYSKLQFYTSKVEGLSETTRLVDKDSSITSLLRQIILALFG